MASEKELRSFTLLACTGVKASPDSSVMMIQFVELQDDSSIVCLHRLGFCWFSEQNQVVEARSAEFVTADTRREQICETAPLVTAIHFRWVTELHLYFTLNL